MISNLPNELIEHVTQHLDTAGLCALRLASRGLGYQIFRSWAKCLNTIRVDLGSHSLQRLLAIGQSETLREHVHSLYIWDRQIEEFGKGLEWSRDASGSLLLSKSNEQFKLFQTCLYHKMKNCRTFSIHGWCDGAKNTAAQMLTVSEVTMLFLNIVAETGLEIQSFTVDLHGSGWLHAPRLKDFCTLREQPQFNQGWSHLEELQLHQDIRSDNVMWTRDLILKAPNLRKLGIKFHRVSDVANKKILDLELPPLEEFSLCSVDLTAPMLLKILRSSQRTLQKLKLQFIYLEHSGLDDKGALRDWKYIFRTMRANFSKLYCISLLGVHTSARTPEAWMSRMHFPALLENDMRLSNHLPNERFELRKKHPILPNRPKRGLWVPGVTYEGSHMATALERLEEAIEYI